MKNMLLIILMLVSGSVSLLGQDSIVGLPKTTEMPYFSGCESFPDYSDEKRNCSNQNLVAFIARNLDYPTEAMEEGIEGTVYVRFKVNASGQIENPQVLNEIGGGCDAEALRVIDMMPGWEPAQSLEGAVEVELDLPVQFALKNTEPIFSESHVINWGSLKKDKISRQELLENAVGKIIVRDKMGNDLDISNLAIAYQRKRFFKEEESTGVITNSMKKLFDKVKAGGQLLITATVVEDGDFVEVGRLFDIVE